MYKFDKINDKIFSHFAKFGNITRVRTRVTPEIYCFDDIVEFATSSTIRS